MEKRRAVSWSSMQTMFWPNVMKNSSICLQQRARLVCSCCRVGVCVGNQPTGTALLVRHGLLGSPT